MERWYSIDAQIRTQIARGEDGHRWRRAARFEVHKAFTLIRYGFIRSPPSSPHGQNVRHPRDKEREVLAEGSARDHPAEGAGGRVWEPNHGQPPGQAPPRRAR